MRWSSGQRPGAHVTRDHPVDPAYLAEAHLAAGMTAEALREAVRARQIQPEYGLAHFIEGLVLYHAGRLPEAEAALEAAVGVVPPWGMPRRARRHSCGCR